MKMTLNLWEESQQDPRHPKIWFFPSIKKYTFMMEDGDWAHTLDLGDIIVWDSYEEALGALEKETNNVL